MGVGSPPRASRGLRRASKSPPRPAPAVAYSPLPAPPRLADLLPWPLRGVPDSPGSHLPSLSSDPEAGPCLRELSRLPWLVFLRDKCLATGGRQQPVLEAQHVITASTSLATSTSCCDRGPPPEAQSSTPLHTCEGSVQQHHSATHPAASSDISAQGLQYAAASSCHATTRECLSTIHRWYHGCTGCR